MKRYLCTVTAGLLLALAGSGTAVASLPVLDQAGTQSTSFGDQTVGEQKNDADVNQLQGNGNVNISPAVAVFGDASTENAQGNGNSADATVEQENAATQSQSSDQTQSQYQGDSGGSCCDGQSQTGEQKADFGDQTVGEQKNDADVNQFQGNGNVNVSPAIAVFGDASTKSAQGNDNDAYAYVDQSNEAHQSQDATQDQRLVQRGGTCCDGQSQAGEQRVYGGDQTVEKQKNDADVTQKQGNGNVNVSPAIAVFGDASTRNYQGNHNKADASVDQSNAAHQSQSAEQSQYLHQSGGRCCEKSYDCKSYRCEPKKETCCDGQSQTGEQRVYGGDQTVEKQKNDADVTQKQGNGNVNVSPAIAFGGKHGSCDWKCSGSRGGYGGDASTRNAQGNGNDAYADIDQSNAVEQSQLAGQRQGLVQACKEVILR